MMSSRFHGAGHPYPILRAAVFALLFFAGAELGHYLSFEDSRFATFWPPAGILLSALLLAPRRQWPLLILWCAAANHFSNVVCHGQPALLSLSFITSNALTGVITALLLQWATARRLRLANLKHMLLMIAVGGFICPMLSATLGTLALLHYFPEMSGPQTWRIWWVADALGALIVAPLLLLCLQRQQGLGRKVSAPRLLEFVALTSVLLVIATYVFHGDSFVFLIDKELRMRFPIMLLPLLVWIALRFDLRGVALANGCVAMIAIYYTSRGDGPFTTVSQNHALRVMALQGYVAIVSLICLTLGAGFFERRQSERRLSRLARRLATERHALHLQKDLLQAVLDSISDGVTWADEQGRLVHFNPAAERLYGGCATELPIEAWPQQYGVFLPDGRTRMPYHDLPLVRVMVDGADSASCEAVIKHDQLPEAAYISATARPVRNSSGAVVGAVAVTHDLTEHRKADEERLRLIGELQSALREIKTLKGLIPICACCKSIRDDDGYWQKLEAFLVQHTEAEFSHGICEDCGDKLYGPAWRQSLEAARIPAPPSAAPVSKTPPVSKAPLRQ